MNLSFGLLDGNLFGCSASTFSRIIDLTIQDATGLHNAHEEALNAYNCGNSVYVLPIMTIAVLAGSIVFAISIMFLRGQLALQWRISLERAVNPYLLQPWLI